MIGALGSTSDPVVLVPGSVQTLRADADDLDRMAADLDGASDDAAHRTVPSWESDTAQIWDGRRRDLVATLDAVAGIYRTVAVVLRAHAEVVGWAQGRAQVAIGLWATGVNLAAAGGVPVLALRQAESGPFARPGLPEGDDGAAHRRQAEVVLAGARQEVQLSASASARLLDELCADMPDGQFHFDQFLGGIGDWIAGIADLIYRFNSLRFLVDAGGVIGDAQEMGQGLLDTGAYLADNPFEAVPALLNTQQLHDNPGRWWGALFPDLALTAAGGVGVLTKAGAVGRLGDNLADLAQRARALNWADDAGAIDLQTWLRRDPIELTDGSRLVAATAEEQAAVAARIEALPEGPVRAGGLPAAYQQSVYGPTERIVTLQGGSTTSVDGITSAYGLVPGDAKLVTSPSSSFYIPETLGDGLDVVALNKMDRVLETLCDASEALGSNGVVEIVTNNAQSAAVWEARMRALDIPGYVRLQP